MNGNLLIPFVVSLSNHDRNLIKQRFLKRKRLKQTHSSFPRMRESSGFYPVWIPAFAGMTVVLSFLD
jgi:hypothetical protein